MWRGLGFSFWFAGGIYVIVLLSKGTVGMNMISFKTGAAVWDSLGVCEWNYYLWVAFEISRSNKMYKLFLHSFFLVLCLSSDFIIMIQGLKMKQTKIHRFGELNKSLTVKCEVTTFLDKCGFIRYIIFIFICLFKNPK